MAKQPLEVKNRRERAARSRGGGPAGAGGYNYQAAVTGVVMAHAISGLPLGWLHDLLFDAPCEIASETGGGGDDIRLSFSAGQVAEAQVKKGLRGGKELEAALGGLAEAIHSCKIAFGCLVVDPSSSRTITRSLAADLVRIGEEENTTVEAHAADFRKHLAKNGMDVRWVCSRLRVVTVPALDGNDSAVRTAMAHLAGVCANSSDAPLAWDRLYRDAHAIMARRGRRTRSDIMRVLRSANIKLRADPCGGPGVLLSELCDWTLRTTETFSILGVRKPLLLDEAWLPLPFFVRDELPEADGGDLAAAIARYHSGPQRREQNSYDVDTLGRFRRHLVIVGGAGSGKTTLLKKLARIYAKNNFPVLRVSALAVTRRMVSTGEGFATAAFAIGLDGSRIPPERAQGADLGDWVILCDGLDECGADQQRLAEGLLSFVAGQPNSRVVVTTRTVGYWTPVLAGWRHYDLAADGSSSSAAESITTLVTHILPRGQKVDELRRVVDEGLEKSEAGRTAVRSPLLLSLCAALVSRGASLGRTRLQFYRSAFALLEAEPPARAGTAPASSAVLGRFLDVLGWTLLTDGRTRADAALRACAEFLQLELGIPILKARDLAERCFAYWQALGVVERVHHAGDEALIFIHKTFAEFAAGRFIALLPTDKQAEILATDGDVSGLSEAIAFASALGAGPIFVDDLLARGFEGAIGQARVLQALEIIYEADPLIDATRVEALVDVAVGRLAGNHRTWALETGAALMRIAARYSGIVAPRVSSLRSKSGQTWTRLAAWAVMFAAKPNEVCLENLLKVMESFAETHDGDVKPLGGGYGFVGRQARDLFESFAYGIAERILSERSGSAAEELLDRFTPLVDHGSFGFYRQLSALCSEKGVKSPRPRALSLTAMPDWDISKFKPAQQRAFITIMSACGGAEEALDGPSTPKDGPFYNLAGFLSVIGLHESPISDIWEWIKPFDLKDVAHVFHHVASLAGIPLDRLAAEASALRKEIQSSETDAFLRVFERIPLTDMDELDRGCIDGSTVDFGCVERCLRHSSIMVVVPALKLALLAGTLEDWRRLAAKLLRSGKDDTLWAAVHLTKKLPGSEQLSELYAHMRSAPRSGSEHVVDHFAKICLVQDSLRLGVLRWALLSDQVEAAKAAAKWAYDLPNAGSEAETTILLEAFDYWRRIEKPYPKDGGVIPPSPRAKLVEALVQVGLTTFEMLVSWSEDTRSDVVETARCALVERITDDCEARRRFVELTLSGRLPLPTLKAAMDGCKAYNEAECAVLLNLLESEDANLRFIVMPLLDLSHVSREKRLQILETLRIDPEPQIREAAARMIG